MSWFVKSIYFRGDTNTRVMFKSMLEDYDMKNADDVILSGISAGAMAAMYWADYLGSKLDLTKTRYITAPDSGYTYDMKHV
jgi:ribulose 1,5-bisphosphate synthetase/thiazole synthase